MDVQKRNTKQKYKIEIQNRNTKQKYKIQKNTIFVVATII